MDIANKVALVTGGAHRVGKAITMMLADAGAHVVVNYNSSDAAALETVADAEALGVQAMAIKCDVSDHESVQAMAQAIEERFGAVDIIVNSASLFGRFPFPTAESDHIEQWHKVTSVSINGAFYVCNALAPAMLAKAEQRRSAMEPRASGAIINIVDLSVWQPWTNFTAHAVGKSGLLALTQQMAKELAPGIRVNAVAPGLVLPPPNASEKRMAALAQRNLLKQWGQPEDVAKAVRYLVEADFMTGEVIKVDGGEYLASAVE